MKNNSKLKIAVVHDWLVTYAGSERVLVEILNCFPDADLFTLFNFIPKDLKIPFLRKDIQTSFLQRFPFIEKKYRRYLPLMPAAIERFDFSSYDLVLSSSHAVAKGALTTPAQPHICYLQARNLKYAYEDRDFYRKNKLAGVVEDYLLSKIRAWDSVAVMRPDYTIANSKYVQKWHYRQHGVHTDLIYPPVDVEFFSKYFKSKKENYYVTVGRLEPYKRTELIIKAFNQLNYPLLIIGDGTEAASLKKMGNKNIHFLGYCNAEKVATTISQSKAFVFSAREDFGIAPVEAQACGTPVVAYGDGGAMESVIGIPDENPTGVLYSDQSEESLIEGIQEFEANIAELSPHNCLRNSERFSAKKFRDEYRSYVIQKLT